MAAILDPITHPDAWNRLAFTAAGLITPGKCVVGKWSRNVEYDKKAGKGTKGATETLKGLPPAEGTVKFWAWTPGHFAAWALLLPLLAFDPTKGGGQQTNPTTTPATPGASGTTPASFTSGTSGSAAASSSGSAALPSGKFGDASSSSGSSNAQPALSSAYAIDVFHPALAELNVTQVLPPEELGSWEPEGDPADGLWVREIKFCEFSQPPNASVATTPSGANPSGAPGQTTAGAQVPGASQNAASNASGAGKDAQYAGGA